MYVRHWYSAFKNRLESSSLRRIYWAIAQRKSLVSNRREEDFYRELFVGLRRGDLIFDVGANVGAKTDIFLRLGARIVALEPDQACQAILRDRFLRYRLRSSRVTLVDKAVSDKTGTAKMIVDGPGSAVNTISPKWADHLRENKEGFKFGHCGLEFASSVSVETTTLEDLFRQHGVPFFIKIDVEGNELNVLSGMRQPVPLLSFEVNLRAFRSEGIECVQLLRRLDPEARFNYTPDCCSGLALIRWLGAEEFCVALDECTDETIEVFWRRSSKLRV